MNVVIIEDEQAAAERLTKMLAQTDSSIRILASLESIRDAVAWFERNKSPDLIFADIHLADGPSFEIFSQTRIAAPVIFTTAYDQYALQAFRFNGIDYLLKPVKKSDLEISLEKVKRLIPAAQPVIDFHELLKAVTGKQSHQKRILVKYGQNIKTLEIADVAYFYTEEKVTFAVTHEGKRFPLDFTLDELEQILNPSEFFRINRQFIIYIKAIGSMTSYSKSRIKILLKPESEIETIVSVERSPVFKEWLLGKG
jgi:DNA-binding LytR/AlgR family response regulator